MKFNLAVLISLILVFNLLILVVANKIYAENVVVTIVPGASTAAVIASNPSSAQMAAQTSQVFEPYYPSSVEIKPNTSVVWFNNDTVPHTIKSGSPDTGPSGLFDSGIIDKGMKWNHTFTDIGSYSYFDSIYPQMMGNVLVKENITKTSSPGHNISIPENRNLSNFTVAVKGLN